MECNDVIVLLGNCTDGDVRLVGGRNSKEGRVDVCVKGHWVTMCHDRWTHREAEVVCRQLHYLTSASSNAHMYMLSYDGLTYRRAILTLNKKYVLCCFIWSVVCSQLWWLLQEGHLDTIKMKMCIGLLRSVTVMKQGWASAKLISNTVTLKKVQESFVKVYACAHNV